MRIPRFFQQILLALAIITSTPTFCLLAHEPSEITFSRGRYVNAITSLVFYMHEQEKSLREESYPSKLMEFSDKEVAHLWDKAHEASLVVNGIDESDLFQEAYQAYEKAVINVEKNEDEKARTFLKKSSRILSRLLDRAFEEEVNSERKARLISKRQIKRKKDPNVENNPFISAHIKNAIEPYLLSMTHPLRKNLDSIFLHHRATLNRAAFVKAGFQTIATGSRSYIVVARHNKLPEHLVKIFLDTELNKKFDKESWEWLVRRCEGAKKIRDIIRKRKIRHFVIPDKWIYCLPAEPSPPNDEAHTRHLAILLTNDMKLTSTSRNHHAWSHYITKEHLHELFEIMVRAKGSSYRADNIAYTDNDTFAFIDTEYPSHGPDFKSIRTYLNSDMRDYWDWLIKNGGL